MDAGMLPPASGSVDQQLILNGTNSFDFETISAEQSDDETAMSLPRCRGT
jgi:hypothetical protein